MVANLSSHKRGWDNRWEEFSVVAEKGQNLKNELLFLVDEDTNAFNRIMDAFGLPKKTDAEKQIRKEAIEAASKYAIEIPLRVMRTALSVMDIVENMVINGNPNSVSDAGVGALCVSAAVQGAFLNVKINAGGIEDKSFASYAVAEGKRIADETIHREKEILQKVDEIINKL